MTRSLTLTDLAEETGVDVTLLRLLEEIGVIRRGEEGAYSPGDVIRIDAVGSFIDAGVTLEKIAEAMEHGLFTFEYLDRFHPEPSPRSEWTIRDLAHFLNLDSDQLSSVYLAMGLPVRSDRGSVRPRLPVVAIPPRVLRGDDPAWALGWLLLQSGGLPGIRQILFLPPGFQLFPSPGERLDLGPGESFDVSHPNADRLPADSQSPSVNSFLRTAGSSNPMPVRRGLLAARSRRFAQRATPLLDCDGCVVDHRLAPG